MMPTNKVLLAALAATTFLTAGAALAAHEHAASQSAMTPVERDFTKLSADGSRAYQDVAGARLAIFEGQTDIAKKLIGEADADLAKAKTDDSVFMKADNQMMTQKDMAAMQAAKGHAPAKAQTAAAGAVKAWLPVYGAVGLDENYKVVPAKTKAVAEANDKLKAGDSKSAMEKLKLADVDMSIVQAVVPLNETIADVHQAATLIDGGKYFEGSQVLRKVEANVRYDVADIAAVPKASGKMQPAAGASPAAVSAAGPEPYSAPDPGYTPMTHEPVFHAQKTTPPSLTDGQATNNNAPAAGPEPYSAPNPS